jgi:hypothetical protein
MNNRKFYSAIRETKRFDQSKYEELMTKTSEDRVAKISKNWSNYLKPNVAKTIEDKEDIDDYRLNPYAITAIAGILDLDTAEEISEFIFGSKLYMSLETAFGKSVENIVLPIYPIPSTTAGWEEHPEKEREMKSDSRTEDLVWQDVDKYCVIGDTAYITTVKSGPRTLNEDITDSIKDDIAYHSETWLEGTQKHHPEVEKLNVTIGLTYGTDHSTNNKEMRILLKLVEEGFVEIDRDSKPGVIQHPENDDISVESRVGIDFWSYVGSPQNPDDAEHVFLEVLLGMIEAADETGEALRSTTGDKIHKLTNAVDTLTIPESSLPEWIESNYEEDELVRMAQTLTLYYDEGFQ